MSATRKVDSGTLSFEEEAEKTYTFSEAQPDDSYRVYVTSNAFVPLRISSQTASGFTVQAGATVTASVGFDVFS